MRFVNWLTSHHSKSGDVWISNPHCITNLVDVFLELVEEVIPASDEATLVLVVYHLQLVALPSFFDLSEEKQNN